MARHKPKEENPSSAQKKHKAKRRVKRKTKPKPKPKATPTQILAAGKTKRQIGLEIGENQRALKLLKIKTKQVWSMEAKGVGPITQNDIKALQRITEYELKNVNYIRDVFQIGRGGHIAAIGHSVLNLAAFTEMESGSGSDSFKLVDRTELHKIIKKKSLAKLGKKLKLDRLIRPNSRNQDNIITERILASVVKGIIGVVYLDGGMDEAKKVVNHLGKEVSEEDGFALAAVRY